MVDPILMHTDEKSLPKKNAEAHLKTTNSQKGVFCKFDWYFRSIIERKKGKNVFFETLPPIQLSELQGRFRNANRPFLCGERGATLRDGVAGGGSHPLASPVFVSSKNAVSHAARNGGGREGGVSTLPNPKKILSFAWTGCFSAQTRQPHRTKSNYTGI